MEINHSVRHILVLSSTPVVQKPLSEVKPMEIFRFVEDAQDPQTLTGKTYRAVKSGHYLNGTWFVESEEIDEKGKGK